jgi:signal transduction histidine kinase
VVVSVR